MESNNAVQRNNYSLCNNQRGRNGGNFSKSENQPPKSSDQESGIAITQRPGASQKAVKTFRDLAIWRKGLSLVKAIYQKTGSFPKDELYGLVSQMRRAAVSIPSNIAEGYRRRHAKEFQQFLNITLGSLGELETQILVSSELSYLTAENEGFLLEEIDHLTRMVISLSKKVER